MIALMSAFLCWMMALIYCLIAVWVSMWKRPVHFFTGDKMTSEEVTDVRAYNRANGKMWAVYAIINAVAGFIALLNSITGYVLFAILTLPGLFVLFAFHKRIYSRYKCPDRKSHY